MVYLQLGFFVALNLLGFILFFLARRVHKSLSPIIYILSLVIFFTIGLYLLSGYGVHIENISEIDVNGTLTNATSTNVIVAENAEGFWFGWFFVAMGFFVLWMTYLDFFPTKDRRDAKKEDELDSTF